LTERTSPRSPASAIRAAVASRTAWLRRSLSASARLASSSWTSLSSSLRTRTAL
jgi:hypothetical protein